MKGFIFRLCVIILIIVIFITSVYSNALNYRLDTFKSSDGDVLYDSMIFTDFTPIKAADGQELLVVGGSVYPDNDRNANRNVFFKLYESDGTFIATSGLNEINCNLLLNDIEKTDYGFAIICEVRGTDESYGKVYEYTPEGKYIRSRSLRYAKQVPQEAGTEYGISTFGGNTYYTATDSDKTVCLDADGKYLFHINNQENSVVNDAVVINNVIYTSGSIYSETGIPGAFIYAYNMTDKSLVWKLENISIQENNSKIYSQIEDIRIIIENETPVSVLAYGKYFDSLSYEKYILDKNINIVEEIDTISKKCLQSSFPLHRTGLTEKVYSNSPYPSAFFATTDISGNLISTKTYEATPENSLSSVSTGSSSIETKENFTACIASVNTTSLTDEIFKTHLEVINSNLETVSQIDENEPTKYKTFFVAATAGKLFTYTTINSTDTFSTKLYSSANDYSKHVKKLQDATDDIYYIREIMQKLPICIMFSMLYVMSRLHSLSRGVGYIPKKKKKKSKNNV